MPTLLPRRYLRRFADPGDRLPVIWVFRPEIGEWKPAPLDPEGAGRHFNAHDDPARPPFPALEARLGALDDAAAAVTDRLLAAPAPLPPGDREVLAEWLALMAIRLSARSGALDEVEALRGHEELAPTLREMGWVIWEAVPPAYFITSSSPFHVAFPRPDASAGASPELSSPGVEITMPLTPRLALHATWKRRGELFRVAGEDALLELNGRTMLRARRFLAAHRPAVPG